MQALSFPSHQPGEDRKLGLGFRVFDGGQVGPHWPLSPRIYQQFEKPDCSLAKGSRDAQRKERMGLYSTEGPTRAHRVVDSEDETELVVPNSVPKIDDDDSIVKQFLLEFQTIGLGRQERKASIQSHYTRLNPYNKGASFVFTIVYYSNLSLFIVWIITQSCP